MFGERDVNKGVKTFMKKSSKDRREDLKILLKMSFRVFGDVPVNLAQTE